MPIHDKVEEVDRFIKRDIDQTLARGLMEFKDCWMHPGHWIATACMFPRHFMPHMTPLEAVAFMPAYEHYQASMRNR